MVLSILPICNFFSMSFPLQVLSRTQRSSMMSYLILPHLRCHFTRARVSLIKKKERKKEREWEREFEKKKKNTLTGSPSDYVSFLTWMEIHTFSGESSASLVLLPCRLMSRVIKKIWWLMSSCQLSGCFSYLLSGVLYALIALVW